VIEELKQ